MSKQSRLGAAGSRPEAVPGLSRSRRRARLGWWALLALAATGSWLGVVHLVNLPTTDSEGRQLLRIWHGRTSTWWSATLLDIALVTSLALAGWLLSVGVRRVGRRRRTGVAALAVGVWLSAAGCAALWGYLVTMTSDAEGSHALARGPGEVSRLVTQDGFDGDVVLVWRPVTATTWALEPTGPGNSRLDPRRGPCFLTSAAPTGWVLRCGDSSQRLR